MLEGIGKIRDCSPIMSSGKGGGVSPEMFMFDYRGGEGEVLDDIIK